MEISFMRALRVDSSTNPLFGFKNTKIDPATMAVINTMKGENSSVYDKETSRKIGGFLKSQLGDYDKKTGVFTRRIGGEIYLFTGQEAKKARKINSDAKKEMIALEEKYQKGPDENSTPPEIVELQSEEYHKICRQNVGIKRDRRLLELVEDNRKEDIPYSKLNFKMDENGKLKEIGYIFSGKKDGEYVNIQNTLSI